MSKTPLGIVPNPAATSPPPPRNLGPDGQSLWRRVMEEYQIEDCGGVEMLAQACQGLDRAEALRREIERDGQVLRLRGTVKDHPALKHELANRAFVVRTLARLGLNFEPVKPSVGRPGNSVGWSPP
jgi:hypothetical protein